MKHNGAVYTEKVFILFNKCQITVQSWLVRGFPSKWNVTGTFVPLISIFLPPLKPPVAEVFLHLAAGCWRPGAADGRLVPSPKFSTQDGWTGSRSPTACLLQTQWRTSSHERTAYKARSERTIELTFNPPPAVEAGDALTETFFICCWISPKIDGRKAQEAHK